MILTGRSAAAGAAVWIAMDLTRLIEIVLVPVGIALLALLWPMGQSRVRRDRFERLVYEELLEAAPQGTNDQWHAHLDKEFVHARLIQNAPDASEFILSLPARSTYELPVNQLWASYMAASQQPADPAAVAEYGARWCRYLKTIADRLAPTRPPRSW